MCARSPGYSLRAMKVVRALGGLLIAALLTAFGSTSTAAPSNGRILSSITSTACRLRRTASTPTAPACGWPRGRPGAGEFFTAAGRRTASCLPSSTRPASTSPPGTEITAPACGGFDRGLLVVGRQHADRLQQAAELYSSRCAAHRIVRQGARGRSGLEGVLVAGRPNDRLCSRPPGLAGPPAVGCTPGRPRKAQARPERIGGRQAATELDRLRRVTRFALDVYRCVATEGRQTADAYGRWSPRLGGHQ